MGHLFAITQRKIRHFIKRYCNDLDIKQVLSSFLIGFLFSVKVKDPVADVWFLSLYVLAVMPDTSVKPAGIFPRVLEST